MKKRSFRFRVAILALAAAATCSLGPASPDAQGQNVSIVAAEVETAATFSLTQPYSYQCPGQGYFASEDQKVPAFSESKSLTSPISLPSSLTSTNSWEVTLDSSQDLSFLPAEGCSLVSPPSFLDTELVNESASLNVNTSAVSISGFGTSFIQVSNSTALVGNDVDPSAYVAFSVDSSVPYNLDAHTSTSSSGYSVYFNFCNTFTSQCVVNTDQPVNISQSGVLAPGQYYLSVSVEPNFSVTVKSVQVSFDANISFNPGPTPTPTPTTLTLLVNPPIVVGGSSADGTVQLSDVAPASGANIMLQASAHRCSGFSPAPVPASVPSSVIVPAEQASVDFDIATSSPLWPSYVDIMASYGQASDTKVLTVTPGVIPQDGDAADARVLAIIEWVLPPGTTNNTAINQAFSTLADLRNQCQCNTPTAGLAAEQDIYLAAAEHYLFALTLATSNNTLGTLVRGYGLEGVSLYDLLKLLSPSLASAFGTGGPCPPRPPSPATLLSAKWGTAGVLDGILIYNGGGGSP